MNNKISVLRRRRSEKFVTLHNVATQILKRSISWYLTAILAIIRPDTKGNRYQIHFVAMEA